MPLNPVIFQFVAFNDNAPATHCAILVVQEPVWTGSQQLRPMRMIHAIESHPAAEVSLVPWWRNRLRFAFRFPAI